MDLQPIDILKWIGIALAAGFIGYFGRYLAMLMIEKIHKRKTEPVNTVETARQSPEQTATIQEAELEKARLKAEKKKAKAEAKKVKKEG